MNPLKTRHTIEASLGERHGEAWCCSGFIERLKVMASLPTRRGNSPSNTSIKALPVLRNDLLRIKGFTVYFVTSGLFSTTLGREEGGGTSFGFNPFQFSYPPRKLTMEEMLYKFIDEGRQEHKEMGAFIREFKTTNELLLKERNNSLSELEFERRKDNNQNHSRHKQYKQRTFDLGPSISLMPYTTYEKLGLGEPKPTRMSLELAYRSIQYPRGIAENVLIKIDKFILPIDFVILDMREDSKISMILGRPFLATARAMIDVFNKKITLRVGNEEESIYPSDLKSYDKTDETRTPIRRIEEVNMSYSQETKNEHLYSASANEIDEKRPLLKYLPSYLEYAYLKGDESCPVIISSKLTEKEKVSLLQVLEKRKGEIAWKMSDIKGIRFFQIPIAPEDQEKMTFTCLYGTFAYRRMSFGLCNAPATSQRCMTTIFHEKVEDFLEVFMDALPAFSNSFD
nr:hypothetical protein [Tanacetum cinerariifolium]